MSRPQSEAPAEVLRSRQNARLKDLRRRLLWPSVAEDGLLAIEGENLIAEALRSGLRVDALFLREDRSDRESWRERDIRVRYIVAVDAFDDASATEAPQGIAALVEAPQWSFDTLMGVENPMFVILAGLQDPGNVGTIVRTAEAFGASGVLLLPGTAHLWSQKTLRASAGSCFRLPVIALEDVGPLRRLIEADIPLYACAAHDGESIVQANFRNGFGIVVGNEGAGISEEVMALCSGTIRIPCPGPVESLNAAIAASIVLYEASRQRANP